MDEIKSALVAAGLDVATFKQAQSPKESQFYSIHVPAKDAGLTWRRLKDNLGKIGWYPVILHDEEELAACAEVWTMPVINPQRLKELTPQRQESTPDEFFAPALEWLGEPADSGKLTKRTSNNLTDSEFMSSLRERFPNMSAEFVQLSEAGLKNKGQAFLNQMIDAICTKNRSMLYKLSHGPSQDEIDLQNYECPDAKISTSQEFIEVGERMEPSVWLAMREKASPQYYSCPVGEWPANHLITRESTDEFQVSLKTYRRGFRNPHIVLLLLLPTTISWHVPALLHFGIGYGCPPQAHVAILKYWYEHYGAEVITISPDTIELAIAKPITTKEEALRVAHDHFIYCGDVIQQGFGELAPYAAALLNAKYWGFWWD